MQIDQDLLLLSPLCLPHQGLLQASECFLNYMGLAAWDVSDTEGLRE